MSRSIEKLRRFLPPLRTVLAGALLTLAFPPFDLGFLGWVALIPYFWELRAQSLRGGTRREKIKRSLKTGLWVGFWMTLGCFFWVAHALSVYGKLPYGVGVLGLVLYGAICQPQFAILSPLIQRTFDEAIASRNGLRTLGLLLLLAIAYASLDWVLPKLFVDTLGHSQYKYVWLRQIADLGGAPLLTFLLFFGNSVFFVIARKLKERGEPSYWPPLQSSLPAAGCFVALFFAAFLYGAHREKEIRATYESATNSFRFGLIQANIGDFEKYSAEMGIRDASERVLHSYFSLSDQALNVNPKLDFLVWPETAYPSTFRTPDTSYDFHRDQNLESFVRNRGVPLLFGGYDHLDRKDFNALFFLTPQAWPGIPAEGDLQVYRKSILLPFGEYIPLLRFFPTLSQLFPQVGNFGRGAGPTVIKVGTGSPEDARQIALGPLICYEALFPQFSIEMARKGAQALLNVTNDGWFGEHSEPWLHFALTTFRSIETRRPQLRATNTGVSALILPTGETRSLTGVGETKAVIENVALPAVPPSSLMLLWGDWFAWLGLFPAILLPWMLLVKPRSSV